MTPITTHSTARHDVPDSILDHLQDTAISLYENYGFGEQEEDDGYRENEIASTAQHTLPDALAAQWHATPERNIEQAIKDGEARNWA